MRVRSDRRRFLKTLAGCAAGASLGVGAARTALGAARVPLEVLRLTDSLVLITGAGGNVVVLAAPDGLLMVDGGLAERSAELRTLLHREFGPRPVRILFNTHWHWEHTGSNDALGRADARIIAHENTRLWLGTVVREEWQDRVFPPLPPRARPNSTFYGTATLDFGGERVDYGHLGQAHTDGDIYIFFRNANVLVAGDVVSVGSYPILDYITGGWIGGMTTAAERIVNLADDGTRIIPGVGAVQGRADVAAEQHMLATLKDSLWQLMRKGMGADDMIAAAPSREFDARWGDPALFISNAYRGLYGHVREMGGVV